MQLLEAAWCLTNIAAGGHEETRSLLPALPLLVAHLGGIFRLLLICIVCHFHLVPVSYDSEQNMTIRCIFFGYLGDIGSNAPTAM